MHAAPTGDPSNQPSNEPSPENPAAERSPPPPTAHSQPQQQHQNRSIVNLMSKLNSSIRHGRREGNNSIIGSLVNKQRSAYIDTIGLDVNKPLILAKNTRNRSIKTSLQTGIRRQCRSQSLRSGNQMSLIGRLSQSEAISKTPVLQNQSHSTPVNSCRIGSLVYGMRCIFNHNFRRNIAFRILHRNLACRGPRRSQSL